MHLKQNTIALQEHILLMRQNDSTNSWEVIFPVKLAGLLWAAEQVPLDIVQPLHWPSSQVQAVPSGSAATPLEQAPLGHVASGRMLVQMERLDLLL